MPFFEKLLARRSFGHLAAAATIGAVNAPAVAAESSSRLAMSPEDQLKLMVRFQGSLEPEDCTWYYYGRMFAQIGDAAPKPLCGLVGAETYWIVPRNDGTFAMSASTFSYPTVLDSDEPLTKFENPYTGAVNTPVPNLYRNDSATMMTPAGMIHGPGLKPDPYNLSITQVGDTMLIVHDVGQAQMPQPHRELSTMFVSVADYRNPAVKKLKGISAEQFISRWPSWMGMGDRPGHTIWQVAAKKVMSPDELPAPYLKRIQAEHPTHLSAKPGTQGTTRTVY